MSPDAPQRPPPPSGPIGGYGLDLPPGVNTRELEGRGQRMEPNALASFAVAAGGLLLGWCCFPFSNGVFSLAAIVLGVVALVRISKRPDYSGRGLAIAGIVLAVVGPGVVFGALYLLTL